MRITYDTEFHEDGRTIDLISIGMVAEDGRHFYAVSSEFDWARAAASEWLAYNVLPHLPLLNASTLDHASPLVMLRSAIARGVKALIDDTPAPELWAYYGAYDHVALAQLWGPMAGLPPGVPMFTRDIMQEVTRLGLDWKDLPKQPDHLEHNALEDARHDMVMLRYLDGLRR
jgi:hypothetical protein